MTFHHWSFRYFYHKIREALYRKTHATLPWFTKDANTFLSLYLKPTDVVLEFGSGSSTIWLASRSKFVTSIEHSPQWYSKVKQLLREQKITNVDLRLQTSSKSAPTEQDNVYSDCINSFPDESIDLIIIDGIHRDSCAVKSLQKLKLGGIMIIDNIERYLPSNSSSPEALPQHAKPLTDLWSKFRELAVPMRCFYTSNGVFDTAIFLKYTKI